MGKFTGLIILDGYGLAPESAVNAINAETSPFMHKLMNKMPFTQLQASGMAVGLPDGQMGNSEVGHLNIGAGRVVYQELTRITKSIGDGDFFRNDAFLRAADNAVANGGGLHVMGLVSDGGVHSHINHLFALIKFAKERGVKQCYVHCFMDGRDVSPTSGKDFIAELVKYTNELGYGVIATVSGRFYAMDRDNAWERVEKAYAAITDSEGVFAENPISVMTDSYANGVTDEFIVPTVITRGGIPVGAVGKGDSVIFFNFRPDRARMITRSFVYSDFDKFYRKKGFLSPFFVTMTQYDVTFGDRVTVAYKPSSMDNTLGEYLAKSGKTQFRIAETQKYAHVTFFFNGGVEKANPGEDRILIDSPRIATFDLKPEMSAYEVCDKAVNIIKSGKYDVMILNFANCDMVGHTGIMDAAQKAVRAVDKCVEKVAEAVLNAGGQALITADHGNADCMADSKTGEPMTAHTTSAVPLILIGGNGKGLKGGGRLCDIAPTLLEMMQMPVPEEMTGKSLLQ